MRTSQNTSPMFSKVLRKTGRCCVQTACLALVLLAGPVAFGATYYVDFAGGNDASDGLTQESAWKHSPGDENAAGVPGELKLQAGDMVIFKGGVHYRGNLALTGVSGTEEAPIIFDGNSAGAFGTGRAILDGGEQVGGWKVCESADEAAGNPLWRQIYHADVDVDLTNNFQYRGMVKHRDAPAKTDVPWSCARIISSGQGVLPVAQEPDQPEPIFQDNYGDFYHTTNKIADTYPYDVYYEEGTIGNSSLPIKALAYRSWTYGSAVIQPVDGGAVTFDLKEPKRIASVGFVLDSRSNNPDRIAVLADGKEVASFAPDPDLMRKEQRFDLPKPVRAQKLTFRLSKPGQPAKAWMAMYSITAYSPDDDSQSIFDPAAIGVLSALKDEDRFVSEDKEAYDGMYVAVGAGNQHTYFGRIEKYDPDAHTIYFPDMGKIAPNPTTRYSFLNHPALMDQVGEWCIQYIDEHRSRIYLLTEKGSGPPTDVSVIKTTTGIAIDGGSSHLRIRHFIVQRFNGHGVAVLGKGKGTDPRRCKDVAIANCEVRYINGSSGAGIFGSHTDGFVVEDCQIHHCTGWKCGIYVNRCNDFRISRCELETNAGSGIRHYEAKNGVIQDTTIRNHRGMHSGGMNLYAGCANVILERTHISNSNFPLTISRSARNLVLRNNVFDASGKSPICLGLWGSSGAVGGNEIEDVSILNNTFVNVNKDVGWACAILSKNGGSPAPKNMVIRNNILDHGISGAMSGVIENNIFTGAEPKNVRDAERNVAVPAMDELFVDPANGDWRLKEGSPAIDAGADLSEAAPSVSQDITRTPRPQGAAFDVGAYEYRPTQQ